MRDIVCTGDLFTEGGPDLPNAIEATPSVAENPEKRTKATIGENTEDVGG
jgi:hypothetical protein